MEKNRDWNYARNVNKIFKKSLYELSLINLSSYIYRLLHEEKLCWKNYHFLYKY